MYEKEKPPQIADCHQKSPCQQVIKAKTQTIVHQDTKAAKVIVIETPIYKISLMIMKKLVHFKCI